MDIHHRLIPYMSSKIFMCARYAWQSKDYARKLGLNPNQWRHLHEANHLHGTVEPVVICCGDFTNRFDLPRIADACKHVNATVLFQEDIDNC